MHTSLRNCATLSPSILQGVSNGFVWYFFISIYYLLLGLAFDASGFKQIGSGNYMNYDFIRHQSDMTEGVEYGYNLRNTVKLNFQTTFRQIQVPGTQVTVSFTTLQAPACGQWPCTEL